MTSANDQLRPSREKESEMEQVEVHVDDEIIDPEMPEVVFDGSGLEATELAKLEKEALEAEEKAEAAIQELAEAKKKRAAQLRKEADDLQARAERCRLAANEYDPTPELNEPIHYTPAEPEVLKQTRANGGSVSKRGSGRPSKAKATAKAKRGPGRSKKAKSNGAAKRGPGRKIAGPSEGDAVAAVKKAKGKDGRVLAAMNNWTFEALKPRLNAASAHGKIVNKGSKRAPAYYPA
jgi:hypothetical protein